MMLFDNIAATARTDDNRLDRQSGMSLLGTVMAMGLMALAISYGLSLMSHSFKAEHIIRDNAEVSDDFSLLFRYLHKTFQRRTQIDLETGVGLYDAVTYLDTDNLIYGGFQIETRSSQNLEQLLRYRFENVCTTAEGAIGVPPPPESFFPNMATCPAPNRWIVQVSSSTQPNRRFLVGRGKSGALSAVFKIRSVSNDNVSLLVGVAQRSANGNIRWQLRDLEIWDEMPRQGIEFLQ